jgi:hypothetical protein
MTEMEKTERAEGFGLGTFDDMTKMLEQIIYSVVPSLKGTYQLQGREDRSGIYIDVTFNQDVSLGLFFGRHKRNVYMLIDWIRAQQIFPADRYIYFNVAKPDGTVQSVVSKRVSKHYKRPSEE